MRIIEDLERLLAGEESPFRAQLLREDLVRLGKLRELARAAQDAAAFAKAGARIGWTQGDARTHELREPLDKLLHAVYELERGDREPRDASEIEARVGAAWRELHRVRMERLTGCLSTPVPKPVAD